MLVAFSSIYQSYLASFFILLLLTKCHFFEEKVYFLVYGVMPLFLIGWWLKACLELKIINLLQSLQVYMNLLWSLISNYSLHYQYSFIEPSTVLRKTGKATTYTLTDLSTGNFYYIKVFVNYKIGRSKGSSPVKVFVGKTNFFYKF